MINGSAQIHRSKYAGRVSRDFASAGRGLRDRKKSQAISTSMRQGDDLCSQEEDLAAHGEVKMPNSRADGPLVSLVTPLLMDLRVGTNTNRCGVFGAAFS